MSWEQMDATARTNREERERENAEPPVACPLDGEALAVKVVPQYISVG